MHLLVEQPCETNLAADVLSPAVKVASLFALSTDSAS